MIYAFCYIFLLGSYLLGKGLRYKGYVFVFIGLIPSVLIVVFRGMVGVDTAAYYINYQKVLAGDYEIPFEPLFVSLISFLGYFFDSAELVQAVISFIACALLVGLFWYIDRRGEVFVLLFYPIFFFELTMNAIRFGLAFALWGLGLSVLLRGAKMRGGLLVLSSMGMHVSAFVLVVLSFVQKIDFKKVFLGFIVLFGVGWYLFGDRLTSKASAYSAIDSPSLFSGIVPYFLSVFFLLIVVFIQKNNKPFYVTLFLLYTLGFIISKFSYAGLRIQWLFLAFSIVYFCLILERQQIARSTFSWFCLGLMGFLFNYRYYVEGFMQGASPFLPYHFLWDLK